MAGLYHAHEASSYSIGQEQRLLADLAAMDRSTWVGDPTSWQELSLTPTGTTADGSRYTAQALEQVCSLLAPGLYGLIADLSGSQRSPHEPLEGYSLSEAASLFNMVLRRRFAARLSERCRVVRNVASRTIDGLTGVRSGYLDNRTLVQRALDAAAEGGRGLVFVEAHLIGRRLSLRMLGRRGVLRDPDGSTWYSGWWLANDETGGDKAARGSVLLCDPRGGTSILGPALRSRRGREGSSRLDGLIGALAAEPVDARAVSGAFARLRAAEVALPADHRGRLALIDSLAGRLVALNIPAEVARKAIVAATVPETEEAPGLDARGRRRDPCFFAVLKAISRMARTRHVALRERLERAAYALLNPTWQVIP